jgi:hypothetical protein
MRLGVPMASGIVYPKTLMDTLNNEVLDKGGIPVAPPFAFLDGNLDKSGVVGIAKNLELVKESVGCSVEAELIAFADFKAVDFSQFEFWTVMIAQAPDVSKGEVVLNVETIEKILGISATPKEKSYK